MPQKSTAKKTTAARKPAAAKAPRLQEKPVIYQMLPRLFSNDCSDCIPDGDISRNGCGKMNHITARA